MKYWKFGAAVVFSAVVLPLLARAAEPEKQVYIEARIVKLRDDAYQHLKLVEALKKDGTQLLDADAKAAFMTSLAKCKACETIAAPSIMALDRQKATFQHEQPHTFISKTTVEADATGATHFITKEESRPVGIQFHFTPKITADGQRIQILVEASETTVSKSPNLIPVTSMIAPVFEGGSQGVPIPFTQFIERPCFDTNSIQQTVVLPNGQSMLVKLGSRACESRMEFGPPVISQIPYLNRLFKNEAIAKDIEHSVMLLTAIETTAKPALPPVVAPKPVPSNVKLQVHARPMPAMPPVAPTPATPTTFRVPLGDFAVAVPPLMIAPPCTPPLPPVYADCFSCQPAPARLPAPVAAATKATPTMLLTAQCEPQIIRCDGKAMLKNAEGCMTLTADRVEIRTAAPAKNPAILKILLEQYDTACKTGDSEKAKTIAAFCLEMDPTCFAKR